MTEKIYFLDNGSSFIADFVDGPEPDATASFEIKSGMSRLANRYSVKSGKLVDDYPDDDDEAVCVKHQEAEIAAAKKIEDDLKKAE